MKAALFVVCVVFFVNENVAQDTDDCDEKANAILSIFAEPNPRKPCPANVCDRDAGNWEPENEDDDCPAWCVMFNGDEKGEGAGCKEKILCNAIKNAIADTANRPDPVSRCRQNPCSVFNTAFWDDESGDCPRWCVRDDGKCFSKFLNNRETFDRTAVVRGAQMRLQQQMGTQSGTDGESTEGGSNPTGRFLNVGGGGGGGGFPIPPCIPNAGTGFPGNINPNQGGFPNLGGFNPSQGGGIPPFPGGFPPLYTSSFPFNCPGVNLYNNDIFAQNYEPPINIPYCDRIPCSNYDPSLENDPIACHAVPGCYFDGTLQHIRQIRQGFMLGVPVCHLVIRNRNFQRLANQYLSEAPGRTWESVYTQCFIDQNRDAIFAPQPGCYTLQYFYQLGGYPKYGGWENIPEDECVLIGGCWQSGLESHGHNCYLPSQTGDTRVRSAVDTRHNYPNYSPDGSDIYGLPKCRDFKRSSPQDYLRSYYECRQAGCVLETSVNENNIKLQFFDIATSDLVPQPIRPYFWGLVNSNDIRPDNWKEELAKLIGQFNAPRTPNCNFFQSGQQPSFGSIYPNLNPQSLVSPSVFAHLGPLRLDLRNRQNQQNSGTDQRQFSFGTSPPGPSVSCAQLQNTLGNPSLFQHFSFLCSNDQQYACPYDMSSLPQGYLNFLPPLPGRTDTCCRRNSCYLPRGQITQQRSGATEYDYFYSPFSKCDKPCGGGKRTQRRICVASSIYKRGKQETDDCKRTGAPDIREQLCNTQACPYWGPWGAYGACQVTCGEGVETRSRTCINGDLEGNNGCPVDEQGLGATQTRACNLGACPVYANPDDPTVAQSLRYSDCPCAPADGTATYQTATLPCIENCDGQPPQQHSKPCEFICSHEDCNLPKIVTPCEVVFVGGQFRGCLQRATCKCDSEVYKCTQSPAKIQSCNNDIVCRRYLFSQFG